MGTSWFVRGDGKVYGPLDGARLRQLAVDGKINGQTEVAVNASGPWHRASNVKGLFPPPAAEVARSETSVTREATAVPRHWDRWAPRIVVYAATLCACSILILWAGISSLVGTSKVDTRLMAAHPAAFERGLNDGIKAGQAWAEKDLPNDEKLKALAYDAAQAAIPSNTALVGSGSEEERVAYAQAFASQFPLAYQKEMPLRLKRARQRGEDDGHQAGFLMAKVGKREPDSERLAAAAAKRADEAIPSNTALVGSGTDEERREYVEGFVSQFGIGYRKAD